MSAIRPDLPIRPFAGAAASPGPAALGSRTSAFFRAAMGEAAPAAEKPAAPVEPTPVRAIDASLADLRMQRPGSLLDIRV